MFPVNIKGGGGLLQVKQRNLEWLQFPSTWTQVNHARVHLIPYTRQ